MYYTVLTMLSSNLIKIENLLRILLGNGEDKTSQNVLLKHKVAVLLPSVTPQHFCSTSWLIVHSSFLISFLLKLLFLLTIENTREIHG